MMSLPRLRRSRKRPGEANDSGSMPMALLVTLVGMSLTAAMVPTVITQISSTRSVTARTAALDAAQAGIDAAVAQLRAATTTPTSSAGKLENLPPCTLTGSQDVGKKVGTKQVGLRYRVTIAYYGLPDNAVDDTPVLFPCAPTEVPISATLTATGSGSATGPLTPGSTGTRTIEATYTFKSNNQNIEGGAIQLASPTTNPLCMDGGPDASPPANSPVTLQLCKAGGSSDQRFGYTSDLNIKLIGSETTTVPAGMCLDAPVPHAAEGAVTFQPCLGRTARQQWSLTDSSTFRGTGNGVTLDGYCLHAKNPGAAGPLVLRACAGNASRDVFRSETGVGAGMAPAKTATGESVTGQLVNFKQFSRCLDVTNFNRDASYLIVWFCKQAPDGTVAWNQKWKLPPAATDAATAVPDRIRTAGVDNPGYCLRTPALTSGYVTLGPCSATGTLTDERMKWIIYGDTGNYATSYRIVDSNGNCLTPTDLTVPNADKHPDGTAKVKVTPCTSSELQKWNAPANFNRPIVLTNTREK